MITKRMRSIPRPVLIVVLLGCCGMGLAIYQKNKPSLPVNINTLSKFAAQMPKPARVILFEKDGSSYVEVIGHPTGFPNVPSGPPAYIFDSTGRVRYWTVDTGDSPAYWEDWQGRSNSRDVSMQEALKITQLDIQNDR